VSQQHELVALTILCTAFFSTLFLAFTLDIGFLSFIDESSSLWVVSMVTAMLTSGCTLATWGSISTEFGARLAFPANEAAIGGLMESAASLAAYGFVVMGGWWLKEGGASTFMLIMSVFVWLSMMLFFGVCCREHHLFSSRESTTTAATTATTTR
jgi:hypothetical protein